MCSALQRENQYELNGMCIGSSGGDFLLMSFYNRLDCG